MRSDVRSKPFKNHEGKALKKGKPDGLEP